MWDMVTAAYAICKGRTRAIDIVSVLQPPAPRLYSFLSLTFGLISNLDIGTEHLRWACNASHTPLTSGIAVKGCMITSADARP